MQIDLSGHTALVTGAGRNIGKAIALSLATAGANVACVFQNGAAEAEATAETIIKLGRRAKSYRLDMRDVSSIAGILAAASNDLGTVDILINNAAIRPRNKIADVAVEEWDAVHETNLRGPFFLAQAALPGMKQKKWGRIINISGLDAYWGNPQRPHNVAFKTGIIGLSRALANEAARWGVTVNTVVPGAIDTVRPHMQWYPNLDQLMAARLSRIPAGRIGTVQDIANACTFLASDEANYITAQELNVTGGAFPLVRQPEVEYD